MDLCLLLYHIIANRIKVLYFWSNEILSFHHHARFSFVVARLSLKSKFWWLLIVLIVVASYGFHFGGNVCGSIKMVFQQKLYGEYWHFTRTYPSLNIGTHHALMYLFIDAIYNMQCQYKISSINFDAEILFIWWTIETNNVHLITDILLKRKGRLIARSLNFREEVNTRYLCEEKNKYFK